MKTQRKLIAGLCGIALLAFGACKTDNGAERDDEVEVEQETIEAGEINDREGVADPNEKPEDLHEISAELIFEGDEDLFDELDTDRNTLLDRDEWEDIDDRVSVLGYFDSNRDRKLGEEEFYDVMFDVWDNDGTGFVTPSEYLVGALNWFPGDTEELENFADIDANDDGLLTKPEFVGNMDDVAMFDQWDLDDDAEVASEELLMTLLAIWDVDKDELIGVSEFGGNDPKPGVVIAGVTYYPVEIERPAERVGTIVTGQGEVGDVVSDRGFWLHTGDQKIFTVVREDVPGHEMIDINSDEKLNLTGIILKSKDVNLVAGELESETKEIIDDQDYFLSVYHDQITKEGESGDS